MPFSIPDSSIPSRSSWLSKVETVVTEGAAVLLGEGHRLDRDVAGQAFPLERPGDALGLVDFPVLAAEGILRAVLVAVNEAPGTAGLDLQLVDRRGGRARAPPLRDQLGVRERLPDAVAGSVEPALRVDLAVAGLRHLQLLVTHRVTPFVRSRNSPRRSSALVPHAAVGSRSNRMRPRVVWGPACTRGCARPSRWSPAQPPPIPARAS